jgi:hypothetical protein
MALEGRVEGGLGGGRGVRCGSYRVIVLYCVLRCTSVVVGEGVLSGIAQG